jgi:hypothetical protein
MRVLIYKRHKTTCSHRDDPAYRRCGCAIWLEWNHEGRQTPKSAKTLNWEIAEQRARHKEQEFLDANLGRAPAPEAAKRGEEATAPFITSCVAGSRCNRNDGTDSLWQPKLISPELSTL